MENTDYQAICEEQARLAGELRELGDRQKEWMEEDQVTWDETDTAFQAVKERKQQEDERRQQIAVQDRLQDLDVAPRLVPMPASIRRRRTATPRFHGRLSAFRGENAVDDAYNVGLWLKSTLLGDKNSRQLLDEREPEWRIQTEGLATAGGYTVPDPLSAAIIEVLNETSAAMQLCDVIPMTSDTLSVPRVDSGQTVYYPGESSAITLSDLAFGQVVLTAVKRATLTQVSNELIADSVIAMADRVARRAAYELAYQMDNEFINGDATATYGGETGLIPVMTTSTGGTTTAAGAAWANVTLANFSTLCGLLPDKYWVDSELKWLMRRDFYATAPQALMYAAGGNTTDHIQKGTGPTLFGYPIVFSARMPANTTALYCCFFGNFKEAAMLGQRNDVQVASSTDYAFNLDVTTIRTVHRYDINIHDPSSSAAGAVVGMDLA